MKTHVAFIVIMLNALGLFAQQAIYDIIPGNGNGIRFWQGDNWKIHMGNSPQEYLYGPVSDYSIKSNMNSIPGRGWTWGSSGMQPIAALNTEGHMQIAGNFAAMGKIGISTNTPSTKLSFGTAVSSRIISLYDSPLDWYGLGIAGGQMRLQVGSTNARFSFFGGDAAEIMTILGNGYVGIGTTGPVARLQVAGGEIHLDADQGLRGGGRWLISGNSSMVTVGTTNPGVHLKLDAGASNRIFVNGTSGFVGIGTASPTEKLTVDGKVRAEELIIEVVGAPDYVFEKSYDLKSLDEVKRYIDENKHLPEVPSAKEMEEDGVKVGDIEMILLKKIEELTLYVIELKKENEKQSEEIQQLKSRK